MAGDMEVDARSLAGHIQKFTLGPDIDITMLERAHLLLATEQTISLAIIADNLARITSDIGSSNDT